MEERAAAFARTLAYADADAQLRRTLLQRKCEELERVLRVLEGPAARSASGQQELRAPPSSDQLVAEVGQSIQDAIGRARRIRDELKGRNRADSESEEDEERQEERTAADGALQGILSMARSIRDTQSLSDAQLPRRAEHPSEATGVETRAPQGARMHLEYPRKLKFLVEHLRDKRDEPFRAAFCCKVSEHMSMSAARRRALEGSAGAEKMRLDMPAARIQVSFPKQAERLARAYARLATFINDKLSPDSVEFQSAIQSSTLPRLLPLCARMKLATQMQRVLDFEREDLSRRAPPRPSLSPAAVAHRNTTLARIRRKRPIDAAAGNATLSNLPLSSSAVFASGADRERDLLDSLQDAWVATEGDPLSSSSAVYPSKLREVVLNEASNLVLTAFKQLIVSSDQPLRDSDVASMMRLVRLVDSIALARGRRYRSIVAPPEATAS